MALLTYILLLLYLLNYSLTEDCAINKNVPEYIKWMKELSKDKKDGYKPSTPPPGNTTINMYMNVKSINFQSDKEVFSVQTSSILKWTDERLKWDPDKYHGIKEIESAEHYVWVPNIRLINVTNFLSSVVTASYLCKIFNTGNVSCHQSMLYESWCGAQLTNWPYDVQECNLNFDHKRMCKENYTINLTTAIIDEFTAGWHVSEIKQENYVSGRPGVTVTLVLVREAAGLSAIVIYPALVLTVLNIVTLFLDVRRNVRLAVSCFTLLGHYYFLTQLDIDMPKGNAFTPTILLYYRDSVILTIITILLTFFLIKLCSARSDPHNYIKLINDFVCDNKYSNYLVFPKWESDDVTVDFKSSNEDYVIFANVVNSVFMFLVVFAYFGLFVSKIPK